MAAGEVSRSPQLQMDPWGSRQAAMLLEPALISAVNGASPRALCRRLLLLPPGVEATADHPQLPAEPGDSVLPDQCIDPAQPPGGSGPLSGELPPD